MGERKKLRLIQSKAAEVAEQAAALEALGYLVNAAPFEGPADFKALRSDCPDALVIGLDRSPSLGQDVALAVREAKATRHVPIVFFDGQPAKVERIRQRLPDASYCNWSQIEITLAEAIANPPADPVVPSSRLSGYSGTPLPKKLGIKPDAVVILVGAPADFEQTLGELPSGVRLRRQARGKADLVIWFVQRRSDLEQRIDRLGCLGSSGLWIAWPKKSSGKKTEVDQADVRQVGLAAGLVDYKVCAIDETWSGLKFAVRKEN